MANYMHWLFRRAGLPWLLLLVLLGAIANPALADIYRYVDEDGVIHFSNVPTHYRFRLYISETHLDYRAYFDRYDRIIIRAARKHGVDNNRRRALLNVEGPGSVLYVTREPPLKPAGRA